MPQATKPVNKPMEPPPKDQVLGQRPTVLVATSSRWYPTARLAMALASAGCKVEAVCPVRHPLLKTNAVRRAHVYRGLAPLVSLARAISRSQPDFLVSGDDLTTQHLHRLYAQEKSRGKSESPICALIERSLGSPESFPVLGARSAFMDVAHGVGVRVPPTKSSIMCMTCESGWCAQAFQPFSKRTALLEEMALGSRILWRRPNGSSRNCKRRRCSQGR